MVKLQTSELNRRNSPNNLKRRKKTEEGFDYKS